MLVGLIWVIQVVHYPLFDHADPNRFVAFAAAHSMRISWVVMPLMLAEVALTIALLARRPATLSSASVALGAVLLLVVWLSTFALQVPQHAVLTRGFDPDAHQRLVTTNWLRTFAWSARGLLALWMVRRVALGRSRAIGA